MYRTSLMRVPQNSGAKHQSQATPACVAQSQPSIAKKFAGVIIFIGLVFLPHGRAAEPKSGPAREAPIVMAEIVVLGKKIPAGWLTVSWECKGALPLDHVKRAWISNVLPDGPAAKAGIKIGDVLLAIGPAKIETLTGMSLRWNMERERDLGTHEEFLLQTPGEAPRIVTLKFEKTTGH